MTEADEPIDDTTPTAAPADEPQDGNWRRALPTAALLVVVAVVAVSVGLWLWKQPPATPEETRLEDRQDAVLAGERFASTLVSYDGTETDAYVDSLNGMLADGKESPCWNDVASLVPAVADPGAAQAAAERQQLYDGTVRERAVEEIDSDSARVMLAVDFQMSAIVKEQRTTLTAQPLRLRMDLRPDDGQWLVDTCTIVAPESATGGESS